MSAKKANGREWWPLEWADEMMPPSRSSPNDFIICADGHWYLGYAFDADGVSDHDKRYFSKEINPGDIVKFLCCDELGAIDVIINPDGTFTAHGSVPERATHFWEAGDIDTLGSSLEEFAKNWIEMETIDVPATVTVAMAWWSDGIPHKLTWTYDDPSPHGKAAFEVVSKAEATQ